jgi:hypothetical protein
MLSDIIDREALKEDHMIKLPPAQITCPECGTIRGADEIKFIAQMGWCRNCSDVPAIYRKEVRNGLKTMPSPLRFNETSCSQCGKTFGPGMHGYSHCEDHRR